MMSWTTKKLKGVGFKLAFNFYLASLLIIVAAVFIYNYFFQFQLESHFEREISSVTKIASTLIDADDFSQLKTQADEGTEQYRKIRRTLQDIKRANPEILFIYTMRPTNDKNSYEFVVDADKKPYHIGEKYDVSGQLTIKKALTSPVLEEDYENNQWGTYLTGYAPIKNTAGETVGIVGVDYEVGSQEKPKQLKIASAAFLVLALGFGITSFFVFRRNNRLLGPLKPIMTGISRVAEGNYGYRLNIRTGDEWQQAGDLINKLAEKMAIEHEKSVQSLEVAEEQKDKVLQVYNQVLASATYGKLRLVDHQQAGQLSLEGVLYSETKIDSSLDASKQSALVLKMFGEKGVSGEKAEKASLCISEAVENVLRHAGEGFLQFRLSDDRIRAIISDAGRGIKLEKLPDIIFVPKEAEPAGLKGIGCLIENTDTVYMATSSQGTVVILEFTI